MNQLQNHFLCEKSFENYSDSSVLEAMLTAADVQGNIPAMINSAPSEGQCGKPVETRPGKT